MSDNKVTPSIASVEEVVRELRAMPLMSSYQQINGVIEQACALLSALEKDAARYRWLREVPEPYCREVALQFQTRTCAAFDEFVDTAIDLARGKS